VKLISNLKFMIIDIPLNFSSAIMKYWDKLNRNTKYQIIAFKPESLNKERKEKSIKEIEDYLENLGITDYEYASNFITFSTSTTTASQPKKVTTIENFTPISLYHYTTTLSTSRSYHDINYYRNNFKKIYYVETNRNSLNTNKYSTYDIIAHLSLTELYLEKYPDKNKDFVIIGVPKTYIKSIQDDSQFEELTKAIPLFKNEFIFTETINEDKYSIKRLNLLKYVNHNTYPLLVEKAIINYNIFVDKAEYFTSMYNDNVIQSLQKIYDIKIQKFNSKETEILTTFNEKYPIVKVLDEYWAITLEEKRELMKHYFDLIKNNKEQ